MLKKIADILCQKPFLAQKPYFLLAGLLVIGLYSSVAKGLVISYDTLGYLKLAGEIRDAAVSDWQAGYGPLPGILPLSLYAEQPIIAWKWLHILGFVALVFLLPSLMKQGMEAGPARAWSLLGLSSLAVLGNAHFALSELIFLVMLAASLLVYLGWLKTPQPSPRLLAGLGVLMALLSLQRQSGLFVIGTLVVFTLFQNKRWSEKTIFTLVSFTACLPLLYWNFQHGVLQGGYLIQLDMDAMAALPNARWLSDGLSGWILPRFIPAPWRILFLGFMVLFMLWKRCREGYFWLLLIGSYIFGTWFFTLKLSGTLDPSEAERFISPMYIPFLLALATGISCIKSLKPSWQWIFYGYLCAYTFSRSVYYAMQWHGILETEVPL